MGPHHYRRWAAETKSNRRRADFLFTLYDNDGATIIAGPDEAVTKVVGDLNADGLAIGTYHIIITPKLPGSGFGSYTLSNIFIAAEIANDTEPNGTLATAVVLPLNGNRTGHVGYYFNIQRDAEDWYMVTTTADGLLEVDLTTSRGSAFSVNPLDVNVTVFDNDGITQLGAAEVFNGNSPATNNIRRDGLAPGTYFIKVQCYTTNEFANYTLLNIFTAATLVNDAEPNGTATKATILPLNSSKTGNTGYYYNQVRDTADWYKVTTNANGLLKTMSLNYSDLL